MTITVRNIKRRPGGRESIRARTYEVDEISIGRDAGSDLELPDLRIALHHATLKRNADGTANLEMLGGNSASINGRLKNHGHKLKPGTKIRMGVYEINIDEPNKDSSIENDLTITLEQIEIVEAAITSDDEDAVFGLRRTLPGKRFMAWAFSLLIIGFFLALPIWAFNNKDTQTVKNLPIQADLSWNTGPISLMHANLKNDCAACHTDAFTAVKDQACAECHNDLNNHASPADMKTSTPKATGFDAQLNKVSEMFGRPVDRCASCHSEHNTRAKMIATDQEMCGTCHAKLDASLPHTTLKNASDFGSDHPQFHPTVITEPSFTSPTVTRISLDDTPKGFSGLKFPHKMHMDTSGGVSKMADRIGGKFGDGVACVDCHRPEAGGALFDPVNMQQDCAVCHDLVFEDDEGYERTLRHGEPNEVIASMHDFYQAKALGNIRDAEMNSRTRRRPGRAASLRDLNRREIAFKQADERTAQKVNAIFSKGGACFDCHEIDRPTDIATLDFAIRPISVNDRFYPKSPFDHASHEIGNLTCESCHAAKESAFSSDVLLPKIEVCRDCHVGEESYRQGGKLAKGTLPTTCLTCHAYHDGAHGEKMGQTSQANE